MIKRLHHIGIGVKNLDKAARSYQRLGLDLIDRVSWPGLKAALLSAGNVILELIEPTEPQSRVGKSLSRLVAQRGGGVHHLCFEVEDIHALVRSLRAGGVEMLDDIPQETAGGLVAWLAEDAFDGVMIELCQEGYEIQ